MYLKKLALPLALAAAALALSGCSTMFTGNHQDVRVKTQNDAVGTQLDHVAKFTVISDAYRVKHDTVHADQPILVHRKNAPIVVQVKESDCILPTEEHFDSGMHPAVVLDILATSPLSTSIDSSTGAAWRYDKTLYVTPKIKDTPACRRWLEDVKAKGEYLPRDLPAVREEVNHAGYPYDTDAVKHKVGYEETFKSDVQDGEEVKSEAK